MEIDVGKGIALPKTEQQCGGTGPGQGLPPLPMFQPEPEGAPCCGPPPGPPSSEEERPGYRLCAFVEGFIDTPAGRVPRIKTRLAWADWLGCVRARLGISRDRYRVAPGLYALGEARADSPVLVSANYKLTFDYLRRELAQVDAWLLILDTRGVNVWCAAGKKTFASHELVRQVQRTGLAQVVSHRELILPQLGGPGVSAGQVKKACGFTVRWGPVRARDLRAFLQAGRKASAEMRRVSFSLGERAVLIPVEISLIIVPSLWMLLAIALLSALGPELSFVRSWQRAVDMTCSYGVGVVSGAVVVPLLLPWLPCRSFYLKGFLIGAIGGLVVVLARSRPGWEGVAMLAVSMAVSSYCAMNFTGATPFTSPSGVEKEMRRGIPAQLLAMLLALVLWVVSPFGL